MSIMFDIKRLYSNTDDVMNGMADPFWRVQIFR